MEPMLTFNRPFVSTLNNYNKPLADLFIIFGLNKSNTRTNAY